MTASDSQTEGREASRKSQSLRYGDLLG